jgi:hypothetical protein
MAGGIRAMLVDAEQNRLATRRKLDIAVLARGGSLFIGDRAESQMWLMAHAVTGHVFDAGYDLAEEVAGAMAEVILPFLAGLRSPDASSQTWGSAPPVAL